MEQLNILLEWRTSNIGEKIIGVRNISVKWRTDLLNFNIYVREYDFVNDSKQKLNKTLSADEMHEIIINAMPFAYIKAYEIPIHISNN